MELVHQREWEDPRLIDHGFERALRREVENRGHDDGERGEPERCAGQECAEERGALLRVEPRENQQREPKGAGHGEPVVLFAHDARAGAQPGDEDVTEAACSSINADECDRRRHENGGNERVAVDVPVRKGPDAVAEQSEHDAETPTTRQELATNAIDGRAVECEAAHGEDACALDGGPGEAKPPRQEVECAGERRVARDVAIQDFASVEVVCDGEDVALVLKAEPAVMDRPLEGDGDGDYGEAQPDVGAVERLRAVPDDVTRAAGAWVPVTHPGYDHGWR